MIEVVLFDFGGVLSQEGWKKGLRALACTYGLDADQFIQTAADTKYETGYITGRCRAIDFWDALKSKTGITGESEYLTQGMLSHYTVDERMIHLAKKLKTQKLTVGILSDHTDWLDRLNERFDLFRHFDHVFNSYYMGKGKRDASLFDDVAGRLKTPPARIIFIDDDPGNVERARRKGWNAVLYTDYESFYPEMANRFNLEKQGDA